MDTYTIGFLIGAVCGVIGGYLLTVTYQWWFDRRIRRVELDDYTERLRALDRPQPKKGNPIIVETQRRIP